MLHDIEFPFTIAEDQEKRLEIAKKLSVSFAKRAGENDLQGKFPFENFKELKENDFLSLTVPKKYGGSGLTLTDFLSIQEVLGRGDGATALCLGWHLGTIMNLVEQKKWSSSMFERICHDVVFAKTLINSAHSEAKTGSPTRGGKPGTLAKKENENWLLTGRKTFTSMAPALDYFIVSATVEGSEQVADFLIKRDTFGVSIEEKWDTLGMRATRSDDLVLENAKVRAEYLVEWKQENKKPVPQGWLLHIPACYLGIAQAARSAAIEFANNYQPNSLSSPIKDVPEVRRKIGKIEVELLQARHFLYSVAQMWDEQPERRNEMGPELASVKYVVTNSAVKIVDIAMRIMGGQSLYLSHPIQRYYRDVRAGLHNPPSDDITLTMLANKVLD